MLRDRSFWLGLLPPFVIGALAMVVGAAVPTLGAPVVGIIAGLILGEIVGQPKALRAGTKFCSRQVLQASIVLLGAGMSLVQVIRIGAAGLPVLLGTLVLAIGAGMPLARLLGVERDTGKLVVYGTSICGASAIATMSAVIGAPASAIAVSVAVIVLFNVLAAIVFPYLGAAMHLTPESFGLWAGTAVNDTSSVLAASSSYDALLVSAGIAGGAAASVAVVVKLTRTLALIPLALFESGRRRKASPRAVAQPWWRLVPGFLVLFLVAAAAKTIGVIPAAASGVVSFAAHYGTAVAMTAVGMSSSLSAIRRAGWRPVALGGVLWALLAVAALLLQWATGQLGRLY